MPTLADRAFIEEGNISLSLVNEKVDLQLVGSSSIATKMWKNTGQYFEGEELPSL